MSSAGYSEFPANSRIYRQQGFTVSRRSEPSSRTALTGEQPDPWDLLQPQDATSRHRGAKPFRRCGLLGRISLLSPAYLLSVERRQFHALPPDHYGLLSHLLDLSVSQSSSVTPFVQVGTSRDSSVSGGADYPFTLTQTRENHFSLVSPCAAGIHPRDELDDAD